MSRKIKQGGVFVDLGGGAATGDAVAADVASGKTFSSAVGNGIAGESLLNAVVPENSPILPYQAYVNSLEQIRNGLRGGPFDLHDPAFPATQFQLLDGSALDTINAIGLYAALGAGSEVNFSGNALPTPDIDAILAAASSSSFNSTINLTGSGMGVPTPLQPKTNGYVVFQLQAGITVTNGQYIRIESQTALLFQAEFVGGMDFADSSGSFSSYIGIADNPSIEAINAYLATVVDAVFGGVVLQVVDPSDLPLINAGTVAPVSFIAGGQSFITNADITNAVGNGVTISVMEWADRCGPDNGGYDTKESVTYTP